MERIELKYQDLVKSLDTLAQAMKQPESVLVRDSAIKRFELTYEVLWKYLQISMREKRAIQILNPVAAFRELLSQNLSSAQEVESFLEMAKTRNLTVHTYDESLAAEVYRKIPGYYDLMKKVSAKISPDQA